MSLALLASHVDQCGGTCETTICVVSPCTPGGGTFFATGVLIQILSGLTVVASGTTTSNSNCLILTIPSAGTYTVTTSGNPRYVDTTQTATLACNNILTINLTAASGYVCTCTWMEPIPTTLTATGGTGSALATGSFTLPQTVSLLTPDPAGVCNGT